MPESEICVSTPRVFSTGNESRSTIGAAISPFFREQAEKKNNNAKPAPIVDATVVSADKKPTDSEPEIVEDVPTPVENPVITPISNHESSSERPEEKVEKKEIKEVETPNLVLDDDDDDDEFFDDFFDN